MGAHLDASYSQFLNPIQIRIATVKTRLVLNRRLSFKVSR